MRSLRRLSVVVVVLGGEGVRCVPNPVITPAPRCADVDVEGLLKRQMDPDAVSFAKILLTAIPESLRQIAATNIPAVSSILWEEFLDDQRPQWFRDLPTDIQSYLIREFGPQTAAPPDEPVDSQTALATNWPIETSQQWWQPPESSAVPSWSTLSQPTTTATSLSNPTETDSLASTGTISPSSSPSKTEFVSASPNPTTTEPPSSTSTSDQDAPPANNTGLSKGQKIGIGLGVPLGLAGAAALLFGCCFLWRRRKRQNVEGSVSPDSPGFIPRFAFQEKSTEHLEHREPLTRNANNAQDAGYMGWDEDVIEAMENSHRESPYPLPRHSPAAGTAMTLHDPKPIMTPALYHTHSSNRARGKRTSYTSLHAVTEVTEPDDEQPESPVLGRNASHPRCPSVDLPPIPAAATIKRKPVPESPTGTSPFAESSCQVLQRPTFPNLSRSNSSGLAFNTSSPLLPPVFPSHSGSGSSSSGLALNTLSGFTSASSGLNNTDTTSPTSPVSPIEENTSSSNDLYGGGYSYVEDYGPEYQSGYVDVEDGLYGGHRSLSRYPTKPRRNSREWPLKNVVGSIGHHRRTKSPLWDCVYEGN